MVRDRANWRMKALGAALAAAVMLIWGAGEAVHAQTIMRSPSFNIGAADHADQSQYHAAG